MSNVNITPNANTTSYIGSSISTALKVVPYVQNSGYDGPAFVSLVMSQLQELGAPTLAPKTPVTGLANIENATSHSAPTVGSAQNSGRGFLA